MRVGDVDVVLISDGILPLPASTMSTNVSRSDRNEWFDSCFLRRDMFDWALNIALVCSGERLILIDSGVGVGFEYFTRAGGSVMRLESAGIDFSKTVMPETVPPALRKAAGKFAELYSEDIVQLDQTVEVAAGMSGRVWVATRRGTASWTPHQTARS